MMPPLVVAAAEDDEVGVECPRDLADDSGWVAGGGFDE
jgi:hypothetical protein